MRFSFYDRISVSLSSSISNQQASSLTEGCVLKISGILFSPSITIILFQTFHASRGS